MPTKKRRVGFIPRNDVLEIIGKLSFENNLSYSKIVCILVEEALFKRGIFNPMDKKNCFTKVKISDHKLRVNSTKSSNFELKIDTAEKLNLTDFTDNNYSIDLDSYKKFIMFLKFQEKLKESGM